MLLAQRLVQSKQEIRDAGISIGPDRALHENMMSGRRTGPTPDIRIYVEAV